MRDFFRTFPSYTGFDFMTHESSFIKEIEIHNLAELTEYAAEKLDSDELIVWFRNNEPISYMCAGDIVVTIINPEYSQAKLGDVIDRSKADMFAQSIDINLYTTIYPIEFINMPIEELVQQPAIDSRKFTYPPNTLQFKGWFARKVGNTDKTFMLCITSGAATVANKQPRIELSRLTWQSTELCNDPGVSTNRPFYTTTGLWQFSVFNIADVAAFKPLSVKCTQIGTLVSKDEAATLANHAMITRYYQKNPSWNELSKVINTYVKSDEDKMILMYRKEGILSYQVLDIDTYNL